MNLDNSWEALLKPGEATVYFDVHGNKAFESSTSGYSAVNAWWLAEISRLIYRQDSDEIGRLATPPCRADILGSVRLKEVTFINETLAQCSIIESDAAENPFAVLVFRGTHDLKNWLTNFDAAQIAWSASGSVHAGFKAAFDSVWLAIERVFSGIHKPVFYTGHSLGAALATVAAAKKRPCALYTFGSPRVGDTAFGSALQGTEVHRVVNNRDLVPRVPLVAMGYHHVGKLHYIAHDGKVLADPSDEVVAGDLLQRDITQTSGGKARPELFKKIQNAPEQLADHASVNYVAHLERAIT